MANPEIPAEQDRHDSVFWQAVRDGYDYQAAQAKQRQANTNEHVARQAGAS